MSWLFYIGITLITFILMEGLTWCIHRYVMHGFLWTLHKDHHQKTPGIFEKNDAFFLIFAIPSWLFIMLGVIYQAWWSIAIGTGLTLYGIAYFLVHDVVIHQRFKWFKKSNNRYIKVMRWAHKMHHKHRQKEDGESFGLLIVPIKYWDKVRKDEAMNTPETETTI